MSRVLDGSTLTPGPIVLATVTERIETGRWPAVTPEAMSVRANSIDPSGTRFVDYDPGPGYRPFFAYSEYPPG